jgi:uncharacterized protein YdeI (YjbR/CyaY-like superfamily)
MKPVFFPSPAKWRAWLEKHHARKDELWVGFHKRSTGKASLTWPESVDHALCFGWIDGLRRSLGETSYMIRFTPRRSGSIWSAVNTRRVSELIELRLMQPAGLAAYQKRSENRSGIYSFEQRKHPRLPTALARALKANRRAWEHFQTQAPWYRRTATWWVISAKREETKIKRLTILIADCEAGRRIKPLRWAREER